MFVEAMQIIMFGLSAMFNLEDVYRRVIHLNSRLRSGTLPRGVISLQAADSLCPVTRRMDLREMNKGIDSSA